MTLHEVILEMTKLLNAFYVESGDLTAEDYKSLLKPLHEAVLELAKKDSEEECGY